MLRAFTPDDVEALATLIAETMDRSYANHYPPNAITFLKNFHSPEKLLARHLAGQVVVMEENGRLVATGALEGTEILAVFVHPDRQGHGLGGKMMDRLEELARENGIPQTTLSVSLPSKRFYEARGYQITETKERDVGDGQTLKFWKAAKALR